MKTIVQTIAILALLLIVLSTLATSAAPTRFEAHNRVVTMDEFAAILKADQVELKHCMVLLPSYLVVNGKDFLAEDCTFVAVTWFNAPYILGDNPIRQRVVRCHQYCAPQRRAAERANARYNPFTSA